MLTVDIVGWFVNVVAFRERAATWAIGSVLTDRRSGNVDNFRPRCWNVDSNGGVERNLGVVCREDDCFLVMLAGNRYGTGNAIAERQISTNDDY